jgi:hypothetical protein
MFLTLTDQCLYLCNYFYGPVRTECSTLLTTWPCDYAAAAAALPSMSHIILEMQMATLFVCGHIC